MHKWRRLLSFAAVSGAVLAIPALGQSTLRTVRLDRSNRSRVSVVAAHPDALSRGSVITGSLPALDVSSDSPLGGKERGPLSQMLIVEIPIVSGGGSDPKPPPPGDGGPSVDSDVVPEPGAALLGVLGISLIGCMRRRASIG